MRSVFSRPVGRGFKGSEKSSSTQRIPHFVPERISSSLRDFIILVLISKPVKGGGGQIIYIFFKIIVKIIFVIQYLSLQTWYDWYIEISFK